MAESRHQLAFLDGLRGYASLWVLIGHAMFLTGYKVAILAEPDMAVELFIIISGFLMTYHYQMRQEKEPWTAVDTCRTFWIRRFFRIAPLYYVCLAAAIWLGPELWQFRLDAASAIPGALEWESRYADRYLDQSLTNILMHVSFVFGATWTHNFRTALPDWSIGLEMQYYLVFPFLMLAVLKLGKVVGSNSLGGRTGLVEALLGRMGLATDADAMRTLGRAAGMALLVGLMALAGILLQRNGLVIGAFSMLPMKFHLFAAGMLMAMALTVDGKWKWLLILGAVVVIFVPLGGGRSAMHRGIKIGIVLGFLALIYKDRLPHVVRWPTDILDRILSNRVARWIGDVSYGVYLIHLLVMLPVCGWLAMTFPTLAPLPRLLAALAITVPLTYGLSYFAYRYIEQPGIDWGRKIAGRFRSTESGAPQMAREPA
jgi:peptidoglycan/LPS O-acetylase OafA/YrhL